MTGRVIKLIFIGGERSSFAPAGALPVAKESVP